MEYVVVTDHCPRRKQLSKLTPEQDLILSIKERAGLCTIDQICTDLQDIDFSTSVDGWTPLTLAAYLGRYDLIKYFLENRLENTYVDDTEKKNTLNVNGYNSNGDTALISAAREGHVHICKLLLDAGAWINQRNQYVLQTPLLISIEYDHSTVAELFLDCDADVQITDNVGITPLYAAVKMKNDRIIQKLISCGSDVNIGSQDHAPIFLAARQGSISTVQALCEAGCEIDISNKYGVTPVYEAALKGHQGVVEYLVKRRCNVNRVDMYNNSPLHIAALEGYIDIVDILVQGGSDLRLRDQQGRRAIDIATENGKTDVVQYFLTCGVDILQKASASQRLNSISLVFERGYIDTAELLIKACGKLPLPHYPGVTEMLRTNTKLFQMLFLSGNPVIPGSLRLPLTVDDVELAEWYADYIKNPRSLKELSRMRIRRCLGNKIFYKIDRLPLPSLMKKYLLLEVL